MQAGSLPHLLTLASAIRLWGMTYKQRFVMFSAAMGLAVPLLAGGFWFQLGNPEASKDPAAKDAVVIVRATGCHDPAQAHVSGSAVTAKGTIELKLVPLAEPGTYAVTQQWPAGSAVLSFVGENAGMHTSVVVHADGNRVDRASAKFLPREPSPQEVKAGL